MANPGTAVTALWNAQAGEKKSGLPATTDPDKSKVDAQSDAFKGFLRTSGLQKPAEQSGATQSTSTSKATTIATLVSSLSGLVGSGSQQPGIVTAFIARPAGRANIGAATGLNQLPRPILVTPSSQPMILPKPTSAGKQLLPTTPSKSGYGTNHSVLSSPILPSPVHTWQGNSPFTRKRRPEFDLDSMDTKRRRTPNRGGPEKGGKGLRHFSMKVCEKVQHKGVTSYNEVADELVQEFSDQSVKSSAPGDQLYDQKNIRRRVYDALNVLMAMNIISKEKKEIKWVGLPTNSAQECQHLEEQKRERLERIQQKQQQLQELIVQQISFKNLVERNKQAERKIGPPQPNACIHLPFIIVNTSKKTVIDCSISSDKSEYLFNFDEAFEIHDDIEVLKRMGLSLGLDRGQCDEKSLKVARSMIPKALEPYVIQMANGTYGDIDLIDVDRTNTHSIASSPLATPMPTQMNLRNAQSKTSRTASVASSSTTTRTGTPSPETNADEESEESEEEEDDDLL